MTKRACAVGVVLHAAPSTASRVIGYISAGQEIRGEPLEGEPVSHNTLWYKLECYLPDVRVVDVVEDLPRARRRKRS